MIVRILGEGQFDVPDEAVAHLNELDELLVDAIERGDDDAFDRALGDLLDHARHAGEAVPADHLGPSELILPHPHASRGEVEAILADDGLIPG